MLLVRGVMRESYLLPTCQASGAVAHPLSKKMLPMLETWLAPFCLRLHLACLLGESPIWNIMGW
jgi:hypothetical protein